MTAGSSGGGPVLRVTGLRTDHAEDPLGIDEPRPRFSWKLESDRRGVRQAQYRVVVDRGAATEPETAWDSGWVESAEQLGIEYSGSALASRTKYTWRVDVRAEDGAEAHSDAATFETAFLSPSEWTGEWLACVAMTPAVAPPLIRREFELDGPVLRGRAYISGLGYSELFVNGRRVGNAVLDPAWTDYRSRALYSTYDITEHLRPGRNAVGVALGNGWFESTPNAVPSQLQPQLLMELHVDLEDGRGASVVTRRASGWMSTIDGPVRQHSIYGGETYDARREIPGWAEPGLTLDDGTARWRPAMPVEPPGGTLQAQSVEPIKVVGELAPVSIERLGTDSHLVDFGQNFAGWVRIRLGSEPGSVVSVRHAELINDDRTVNMVNLRTASATDRYTLASEEPHWFEPHFTYHGFRYAQIDGVGELSAADVVGCIVRSSVDENGSFSCDDELLERIHRNIVWTEGSNLHGVPTDCPQRDERLAWLNDMTVRGEQAVHNYQLARLYVKWFDDILDTQGAATGAIADTAPHVRYGRRPADPVVSSFLIVPQLLSAHFGERRPIERHFDDLGRWVSFLESLRTPDGIIEQSEIGDWAPPVSESVAGSAGAGAMSALTPGGLISTGFLHLNQTTMAQFARMLDRASDADRYDRAAAETRAAINERYFDEGRAAYGPGNQASNGFALYLGLAPEAHQDAVLANLVRDIEEHDDHLTTGNICTKYVLDVLGRLGRSDVAMRLLRQRTYPSWGFMVEMGATTIWERWEHVTGGSLAAMGSHNHPMYGAVGSWFYRFLGGISPHPEHAGFEVIDIEPRTVADLDRAECRISTPRGLLSSGWRRSGDAVSFDIEIPPNATANVVLPAPAAGAELSEGGMRLCSAGSGEHDVPGVGAVHSDRGGFRFQLGSGRYRFEVRADAADSAFHEAQ